MVECQLWGPDLGFGLSLPRYLVTSLPRRLIAVRRAAGCELRVVSRCQGAESEAGDADGGCVKRSETVVPSCVKSQVHSKPS